VLGRMEKKREFGRSLGPPPRYTHPEIILEESQIFGGNEICRSPWYKLMIIVIPRLLNFHEAITPIDPDIDHVSIALRALKAEEQ